MTKRYEPYAYVDLGALRDAAFGDVDAEQEVATGPDGRPSCRGKLLLVVTTSGIELLRVPNVLH